MIVCFPEKSIGKCRLSGNILPLFQFPNNCGLTMVNDCSTYYIKYSAPHYATRMLQWKK